MTERLFNRELSLLDFQERVLAIADPSGHELGLITIERPDPKTGRIGLIGVREEARGLGIGTALVAAAEAAMASFGAERAVVLTQLENAEACGLYESFGYEPGPARRRHHFWLEPAS